MRDFIKEVMDGHKALASDHRRFARQSDNVVLCQYHLEKAVECDALAGQAAIALSEPQYAPAAKD